MGIPINDEMMKWMILQTEMKKQKEEVARRLQEDYKVFVSYSHEDQDVVRELRAILDRSQIRYVVDEKVIGWGDPINERIEAQIEICTHYLLVFSANSTKAPWCSVEYGLARGKGKKVLLFLASRDIEVPPYYASVLATADSREVEEYFSRKLIDPAAVERFIGEILDDSTAKLEEFRRVEEVHEGRNVWDHPNREAIEQEAKELRLYYRLIDDRPKFSDDLIRVELGDIGPGEPLVLHYHNVDYVYPPYHLRYIEDLCAVVIDPPRRGGESSPVGVREVTKEGEVHFRRGGGSVEDALHGRNIEGWKTSRSFWETTLRTLRAKLPS